MKRKISPVITAAVTAVTAVTALLTASCGHKTNREVEIETPYGTMRAILYDDTPLHRDNFVRLAESGQYDSLLFHRVLRSFIVQGGDPLSRHASAGTKLGQTSIGEEIEPEILFPTHYHKRGALCAARQSDTANPGRKSSGSQFYIVTGSRQTEEELNEAEIIHDNKTRRQIYLESLKFYQDSLELLQKEGKSQELSEMQMRIVDKTEQLLEARGRFKFSDEIRTEYAEHGGLPQLDSEYTVFGEVVDGLEVLDSITQVAVVPPGMRPCKDIWMVVRVVK